MTLRPVQEAAGEALLAGDNAVIPAPTAGGNPTVAVAFRQAADAHRRMALTPAIRRVLQYYFSVFR